MEQTPPSHVAPVGPSQQARRPPYHEIPSRRRFPLFLVLIYSTFVILAWLALCALSKGPWIPNKKHMWEWNYGKYYHRSEEYYKAARVINVIALVLSIPIASSICARAAAAYVQAPGRQLSVEQVLALADRQWLNLPFALMLVSKSRTKKYGSPILYSAIILVSMALAIGILEFIFLSHTIMKVQGSHDSYRSITDLARILDNQGDSQFPSTYGDNYLIPHLGHALSGSMRLADLRHSIWIGDTTGCSSRGQNGCGETDYVDLDTLSDTYLDPFITQLPVNFSTGSYRQYAPRISTSVVYENSTISEFPANCAALPGAFYAQYELRGELIYPRSFNYSIEVCMPFNHTKSPWKSSRKRQTVNETLFINVDVRIYSSIYSAIFKIQASTTTGYFELPNSMNGNRPGPLLDVDPIDLCSNDISCKEQLREFPKDRANRIAELSLKERDVSAVTGIMPSADLYGLHVKSPLLAVTLSLFGNQSYIATRTEHPADYEFSQEEVDNKNSLYNADEVLPSYFRDYCIDHAPLTSFMSSDSDTWSYSNDILRCLKKEKPGETGFQISQWLSLFTQRPDHGRYGWREVYPIQRALTAATFTYNRIWLSLGAHGQQNLMITYDTPVDIIAPAISNVGIIIVSVLLGLFIIGLMGMAIYSSIKSGELATLDTLAVMKMGIAAEDQSMPVVFHNLRAAALEDPPPKYQGR